MTATLTSVAKQLGSKRLRRALLFAVAGMFVLSVVEVITDTGELTARGTSGAALRLAIPIMLAGLGAVYSERAGIVNIGLEGMMIMGTWFGAWGAWQYGPWWGVVIGMIGGAIGGLIHAVATVTFNVDHIVSGVAVNILALGGMRFLSSIAYGPDTGGSVVQSPRVEGIPTFSLPFLAGGNLFGWKTPDFFGWLEMQDWFFFSDTGGVLRGITGGVSWLTVVGLAFVPLTIWALWRTAWGLRLRSCGENPWAAESLGVPVYRMKYYGVVISGALAGIGGAFLPLVQSGIYREGQTGGRGGFIGLAALIFGNWMPSGVLAGAALFGFGDSLRFRGAEAVQALLLVIAIGLFAYAAMKWLQAPNRRTAMIQVLAGVAFLLGFIVLDEVPGEFIAVTPHIITILVLAGATQRLRMPAADGMRYRRGEAV